MRRSFPLLIAVVFLAAMTPLMAQQAQTAADQLAASGKWAEAAAAYQLLTADEPSNGAAWAGLGEAQLRSGKYDNAVTSFQRAQQLQYQPVLTIVRIARAYSLKGDRSKLIETLQQTMGTGYSGRVRLILMSHKDFAPFRDDAAVTAVLDKMVPCTGPEFHKFDFWVGDWEVQSPTGQPLGTNLITREQDGCVLVEHWKSGRGYETGTSFSYYNFHDKKWHQFYLANQGDPAAYPPTTGELQDGKMVLENRDDPKSYSRWTYYVVAPGKVRQMSEFSADGGKTWQTNWDSIYVKKDSSVAQGSAGR
jgi:Tetratricopeptide repeat